MNWYSNISDQDFIQDFELGGGGGGGQDGSRMVVACESTLTHTQACVPTRWVWGHAPPSQKILNLDPLKLLNNIEATVTTYTCTVVFAVITTTNQVGYIIVIAYVLRDLWV